MLSRRKGNNTLRVCHAHQVTLLLPGAMLRRTRLVDRSGPASRVPRGNDRGHCAMHRPYALAPLLSFVVGQKLRVEHHPSSYSQYFGMAMYFSGAGHHQRLSTLCVPRPPRPVRSGPYRSRTPGQQAPGTSGPPLDRSIVRAVPGGEQGRPVIHRGSGRRPRMGLYVSYALCHHGVSLLRGPARRRPHLAALLYTVRRLTSVHLVTSPGVREREITTVSAHDMQSARCMWVSCVMRGAPRTRRERP